MCLLKKSSDIYTRKYIFTQVDCFRSFAQATSCQMKDSVKNIGMPVVEPYPVSMEEFEKIRQGTRLQR